MPKCIKHTCKDCIHFKICNDYVYLIGREDKVACSDYKSTADVVPRSEVEALTDERDRYKRYYFNHAYDEFEAKAKQEVAREIFEEIERNFHEDDFGDLTIDFMEFQELKKKYIGE